MITFDEGGDPAACGEASASAQAPERAAARQEQTGGGRIRAVLLFP